MRGRLEQWAEAIWYGGSPWWPVLWPFALIYKVVIVTRRSLYSHGWLPIYRASVPVVIVGNLTAGGAGKTPLVIKLAELMMARGIRPGILLRGYGRTDAVAAPLLVSAAHDVREVGDEALMIFNRLHIPVCVCAKRSDGSRLLENKQVDVILCDDGLQHYALHRDLEIAIVDDERKFGNGRLLPAGPMREPATRLADTDLVISHTIGESDKLSSMRLREGDLVSLDYRRRRQLESFSGKAVNAVAGIGNPGRFFTMLRKAGLLVTEQRFPDHHNYSLDELRFEKDKPLLMTEKDAVKCHGMNLENAWFLQVDVALSRDAEEAYFTALENLLVHKDKPLDNS